MQPPDCRKPWTRHPDSCGTPATAICTQPVLSNRASSPPSTLSHRRLPNAALDLGGTLTGEHGVGTAKRAQMHCAFGPVELAAFRAIKRAFDPDGLLNPGVMLPPQERANPTSPTLDTRSGRRSTAGPRRSRHRPPMGHLTQQLTSTPRT